MTTQVTPFVRGHTLSVKHGAWSARVTDPIVTELVAGIVEVRPDLERFPAAVYGWATVEARAIVLDQWLGEHGLFDAKGKPRVTVIDLHARFVRLSREARAELGLSPKSEADVMRARIDAEAATFDLAALRAEGRKVLEAAEDPLTAESVAVFPLADPDEDPVLDAGDLAAIEGHPLAEVET